MFVAAFVLLAAGQLAERAARFSLWQRGEHVPCDADDAYCAARALYVRQKPVLNLRGGADGCSATSATCEPSDAPDLDTLRAELGPDFAAALDRNEADHAADCKASCDAFYCGASREEYGPVEAPPTRAIHMGSVPPEDFSGEFKFPLDLIKVTTQPLIPPDEAERVVAVANAEGLARNEYNSGKYKLGGDWVKKMPRTLEWFNERLRTTIFPTAAALFPEVVRGPEVLRAHSVAVLKYNASHPRTDVHVDDGILALTLALSPRANYSGGGTFYEHLGEGNILPMDQGYCTLRPGSVRHGGHKVDRGERYILGAFLLIADRVEHVRRLNNQGRAFRGSFDLRSARLHFKWALKINPRCATCLKNWAESLSATPDDSAPAPKLAAAAEDKLRRALELLPDDSDAWFSLGVLLSHVGRADEALEAYKSALASNADDHELCYNVGVQLGDRRQTEGEIEMYRRALAIKPDFGQAWSNLGVAYASSGNLDAAEDPFTKACEHQPEVRNNWLNLGRLHMALGRKDAAEQAMQRAQSCAP